VSARWRLETLRESLTRLPGREVRVFVKDNEDLRREKYSAQQAAKEDKKNEAGPAATAAAPASGGKGGNNNNAGNKKEGGNKGGGGGAAPKKEEPATIGHLDIRVGVVVSAEPHPDGDTLYVEQIDVGEGAPRTIVSGIREHVTLEQFVGARVLVMCNLKVCRNSAMRSILNKLFPRPSLFAG
jgi:methionyl-tRNA synthetase